MNDMTNKDLLLKMKEELQGYQIGIHNVNLLHYSGVTSDSYWRSCEYKFDDVITEEAIAERILEKGLNVCETGVGLRSTVSFFKEITEDAFNYNYHDNSKSVCNLLISLPHFIQYNGRSYFIGLHHYDNVGTRILFNYNLPPEFVYGYYTKQILDSSKDEHGFPVYYYSDELCLYENPNFWAKICPDQQERIMQRVFKERKGALSALKLANNNKQLMLLFHPLGFIIRDTREQQKILKLN